MKSRIGFTILVFFQFFFTHLAYSQEEKKFEFTGTLQLASKEIITYRIQFVELANGNIEGTSLTDIFGSDRTVSKIKGKIDTKRNKISFVETGNISTKSDADANTFCYLTVTNANIKLSNGKSVIQGNFLGKYGNGEKCASGSLYLIGADYIDRLTKKYLNEDVIKNEDSLKKMQQLNEDIQAKVGNTYLQSNEVLRLNWSSSEIIIEVCDSRKADGDEIAIYVNGKKVLDSFVISKDKKTIVVPFPESKGSIRIQALNEGSLKMCTANITLRDKDNPTNVVTIMKKESNVVILLNKVKSIDGN